MHPLLLTELLCRKVDWNSPCLYCCLYDTHSNIFHLQVYLQNTPFSRVHSHMLSSVHVHEVLSLHFFEDLSTSSAHPFHYECTPFSLAYKITKALEGGQDLAPIKAAQVDSLRALFWGWGIIGESLEKYPALFSSQWIFPFEIYTTKLEQHYMLPVMPGVTRKLHWAIYFYLLFRQQ